MRTACALVVLIVGCGELNLEGRKSGGVPDVVQVEQTPANPTPPAPVTPPSDPATPAANGASETTPADTTTEPEPAPDETTVPEPQPQKTSIIGQTTDQVVDFHEFTQQHPQMQVAENKFSGTDPISQAAAAYVSVRARASILGMQQALKQHTIINERPPTYAEFMKMMKDHRVTFTQLPARRIYAYDAKVGTIVVLEEPAE